MRRLFAIALVASATFATAQLWKELGPAPITNGGFTGRVPAVVASPTDPNLYYVAGADGGVWRTRDGGVTWTPLTDQMPTTAIGALALDPTNERVIYAGTGEGNHANHSRYGLGLFKSTDGGENWMQLAESVFGGRCFSTIVVSPVNPQTVYAAITPAGGFPERAAAKSHPQRNGPLGVFRSDDAGVSWRQLLNGLPNQSCTDLVMDPTNSNVLYAAIGRIFGAVENGVYKSTDGGESWTKLAGGLPTSGVGRISIAIAPSRPSRLYALVTRQCDASGGGASTLGGYRTDDGGVSWTSIPVGNIQATYGWYLSVVSVQPTNPDVVIMGGLDLVRSTNAGASFSTITPPHVDMHALEWDASGRLLSGNDGGVHRTSNLGGAWASLNVGLGVIQFYAGLSLSPSDATVVLGGTQDNGSNRRSTDSKNWTQVLGGDGGWTQIDQRNPARMFAEFQGAGNLYRSTNGGGSFSFSGSGISTSDRHAFLPPYEIDPANSNRMLYATQRVYESTNGGTSWTAVSGDVSNGAGAIRTLTIAPSNPQIVYVTTNDGNVARSTDGGRTFVRLLTGIPGWPRVTRELFVDPADPQKVYLAVAAFGTDQVRYSADGGATWQALDGDLPDVPVNTIAVDTRSPRPVLYAGTDDGLWRSGDFGRTWRRYGAGLPRACVIDIRLDLARERMVIGTQGRGAWSIGLRPAPARTTPR